MPAGVCDTESVYCFFFYCCTCEEEYMSDLFVLFSVCSARGGNS